MRRTGSIHTTLSLTEWRAASGQRATRRVTGGYQKHNGGGAMPPAVVGSCGSTYIAM